MTDDNRAELGRLIREELEVSRRGPSEIVKGWTDSAIRSFYGWKDGVRVPLRKSRGMLEDALGWRRGVVTEILDAPITEEFTLSDVRDWSAAPPTGLVKARELSTGELLFELGIRMTELENESGALSDQVVEWRNKAKELQARLDGVAPDNVINLRGEQRHYGLAASDDHVPGEDDND